MKRDNLIRPVVAALAIIVGNEIQAPAAAEPMNELSPSARQLCSMPEAACSDQLRLHLNNLGNDPLIERLIEDLSAKDKDIRREAAYALAQCGLRAVTAVPALVKAGVADASGEVISAAWDAVDTIGIQDSDIPAAVSILVFVLQNDHDRHNRRRSAEMLEHIGPRAASAIPALIKASVEDTSGEVQSAARRAAKVLGGCAAADCE